MGPGRPRGWELGRVMGPQVGALGSHRLSPCPLHLRTDHSGFLLVEYSCDSQACRWVRRRGFNTKPRGRRVDGGKGAQEGRRRRQRQRSLSPDGVMPTTAGSRSQAGDCRQAGVGLVPEAASQFPVGCAAEGRLRACSIAVGALRGAWAPWPSSGTLGWAGGPGICKSHDAEHGDSGRGSGI